MSAIDSVLFFGDGVRAWAGAGAGPGFFILGPAFFSSKRAVEDATMTREEIEKRMDELGRQYADEHDELVRAQLEALNLKLTALPTH